ncbi:hypothetical protein ANCCEY_05183 [Ancylostoma ceylanicum]|uniref:Uncharacterized protein n=1 Tax=Ancylostoma ceylanicum TaxID=53326 RepID=A0A0D6LUK1_9BILA|nr:hypothetical protein ANCCEY_05183 [Ancylostoma ceylanicum]
METHKTCKEMERWCTETKTCEASTTSCKNGVTFPYAYRIIHHRDPVPHIPPRLGRDKMFHHRYEVWYNNNMAVGKPYTICQEADGDYCSNTVISAESWEHMWYFDRNLGEWGEKGCPSS